MRRLQPPAGLGAVGRRVWKLAIDGMGDWHRAKVTEIHLRHLEQAARCADDGAELEAAIKRDGYTVTGSKGQRRPHPRLSTLVALRRLEASLLSKALDS